MNESIDTVEVPGRAFDVQSIIDDFPILQEKVRGKRLTYLDNAATTQKPQVVIDTLSRYYTQQNSNIHRGVHYLSELATRVYEGARETVRSFLNAERTSEIIFVRGTTEGVNLVAQTYGRSNIGPGDEILITAMEHHSNIVPWQLLCQQTGAELKVVPMNRDGELLMDEYEKLLTDRTKIVGVVHLSNALGTINPVREMIARAHEREVPVLVDGAQAVSHIDVDVQALDADFYLFSSHKIFGPTGTGVLYGKEELLEGMPPYQGGGEMIKSVTFEKTVYNDLPGKFEAGTPNIAGSIGLGAALDYLNTVGIEAVAAHEKGLLEYATAELSGFDGLNIIGTAQQKASIVSFTLDFAHPHDIGTILDGEGVAIRTGHHCAQPVMQFYGVPATARASFALYNTTEDVDVLVAALGTVREIFG